MKVHDYHLDKYEVSDRGSLISLHLVYGHAGEETDKSIVTFSGVELYHFTNTQAAIISDIEEVPIRDLLPSFSSELEYWNKWYGIKNMDSDIDTYLKTLESLELKAWEITSAIGFYGFIVGREVTNA